MRSSGKEVRRRGGHVSVANADGALFTVVLPLDEARELEHAAA